MSDQTDIASLLRESSRVIVIAPHPDDESLATGGLIQRALETGVKVSVVVLTDGDMNPWPQRAAERKLVVTRADRERWGRRRRQEAIAALSQLGVGSRDVLHLGLPDMGITRRLESDPAGVYDPLATLFRDNLPSIVVAPSLRDTHPDHSAANVMTSLALSRSGCDAKLLSYMVHGADAQFGNRLPLDTTIRARKFAALEEHRTQLQLSRARMLRYAERPERFAVERAMPSPRNAGVAAVLPWRVSALALLFVSVLIVAGDGSLRISPVRDSQTRAVEPPSCVRLAHGYLELRLPASLVNVGPVFARLESRVTSPWIYDRWGWARLA
ncbi:MAG: PIG-L family deacetylase [Gemmatimonadota bacterium]|nr:PIG-L family deacetylase [Gemmatimonadota bacterium]